MQFKTIIENLVCITIFQYQPIKIDSFATNINWSVFILINMYGCHRFQFPTNFTAIEYYNRIYMIWYTVRLNIFKQQI